MKSKQFTYFMCDFETTVYAGQTSTDVWAAGACEFYTEDCEILGSIGDWFRYMRKHKGNLCCYFHNLKFDGSFILYYLAVGLGFKQAYTVIGGGQVGETKYQQLIEFTDTKNMKNNTYKYSISNRGQWYTITIKVDGRIIEIRDSLKLLPFSVKEIGKSFGTKHKKLDMKYEGFRYPNCPISDTEKEYLKNDVYVVKEALEIMFNEGHNRLTIGSCCLEEFKSIKGKVPYKNEFPNVYNIALDEKIYGADNVGKYVKRSYRGGWCYVVKGKEGKLYHNGITVDVNSLYPSVMHSSSGSKYPVGTPKFWSGDYIPDEAKDGQHYYFVRFTTRFYLKQGYLPFVQIKGNLLYDSTENLTTSDVRDPKTGKYLRFFFDSEENIHEAVVMLTMTMTDFELFKEHYETPDLTILDGCYFEAVLGLFDEYIDKYKQIKITSKGARRQLAKLFLNNLSGKMASNTDSSFKKMYINDDNAIGFEDIPSNTKKPGYIPVGSAITSYARNFTIRAAQKNYHGVENPGFIYADTDSMHLDIPVDQLVDVPLHATDFNHWKCESTWDEALFIRQKTYVEHVIEKDLEPIPNPYYDIKCAGMPDRCKVMFLSSMTGISPYELTHHDPAYKELKPKEQEFIKTKRKLTDFTYGLCVPGKLIPKRIPGGTLLVDCDYQMTR